MRQVLSIATKDLRLWLRDRSVFILGLLAPGVLALIFAGPGNWTIANRMKKDVVEA